MIILDYAPKLRSELINRENDNATKKFYLMQTIFEGSYFDENFKILENFKKNRKVFIFCEVLLYELSERETV